MKVFAVLVVATVLIQLALAAPSRSCGCDDSDERSTHRLDHSDRLLIQRAKAGHGFSHSAKCQQESSEEDCGCSGRRPTKCESDESASSSSESDEQDDDCHKVSKAKVVTSSSRCEQNDKIYLHRQAPIYVRPPPSRIFINHPPVVVRQPPVILHHQSRSPVLVKPILIKEREVAARPVLFKISKPDNKVSVSKCEKPKVHVSACSCEREEKPACPCKSSPCTCERKSCH